MKLRRQEDRQLAIDGTYRGKQWRKLEEAVGVRGISALAEEVSSLLEESQRDFDAGLGWSASAAVPVNDNLGPVSTHRVMEQPNPASCATPGDSSSYFNLQGDNAGNGSQAALENAPTQLYFGDTNENVEDMSLTTLWNLGGQDYPFPSPAS
ncbi:hypothetical protein PMIN06_012739 [Paraphaeosphaeria minitans]